MNLSLFFLMMLLLPDLGSGVRGLNIPNCCKGIRFPFVPADEHTDSYPGFNLSCSEDDPVLKLPNLVQLLHVKKDIDYKAQELSVFVPGVCLASFAKNFSLSGSRFEFQKPDLSNYTFFNCSPRDRSDSNSQMNLVPCLGAPGYEVYAVDSDAYVSNLPLISCTKMYNVPPIPSEMIFPGQTLRLKWSKPNCGVLCEAKGRGCRFKNETLLEIECGERLVSRTEAIMKKLKIAGTTLASFLLLLMALAFLRVYSAHLREKINQAKIDEFLQDYRTFKPTRYSYIDLKGITDDFKDKLGQGAYGAVYKGSLSKEIHVAVKMLHSSTGNGEEFINEVGTMGKVHHVNVVRLVGFCADGFRRALVYEFLPNESLEKFIFSADGQVRSLSWEKLQRIALGTAKGIEYLHQGCDQRILHFDIKPHNILLDQNFTPKISDFGLAKFCSKDQSAVSMTAARGTMGYIAPEVFSRNFGNVSYKSDVYSFGMLLLEIVSGRKNVDVDVEGRSQIYFPEWIYKHLEQGEELRIRIQEEGDANIARKLTIIGLWCIQWYPIDRPSMKSVVQMLEGDGSDLILPPNPLPLKVPRELMQPCPVDVCTRSWKPFMK
ncbi:hypothetical protein K2173_013049 [Erythroxylum novogranatense]|uniref:Protein kinase domain-containing protein n=1 Tax=Erythroxylum novogranatense TaxID=1862640 RepID=A0AAV8S6R0_9ROSI|nr:hypothetical protein K2173_013049 [Erythroxylum novogranatense]